jgi:hypothetical protein
VRSEVVVNALLAARLAEHGVEKLGSKSPLHELEPACAKGFFPALIRASAKAVQGNGKRADYEFWHTIAS